jgi:PAS domain S-box-containing protein
MEAPPPPAAEDRLLRLAQRWPSLAAWAVLTLGAAVLVGWFLDVQALKAPLPGLPSMKANTALAFILTSLGILLHGHPRRWPGVAAAFGAGLIGALTLAEYLFGVGLGIDEALVRDDLGAIATAAPGRMSVLTAFCFVLVSSGLLAARGHGSGMVREGLAAGVVFVATFVLGSYAYGAVVISGYTQVALHTAIAFLLLGPAVMLLRPEGMLAGALLSTRLDGLLARRLLPAAIAIPLVLGWIRISLQDAGLVDTGTGAALFAAAMVIVLVSLVILSLARLRAALQRAEDAEAERRAADAGLVQAARRMDEAERVTDRGSWEWDVTTDRAIWSKGMYRLFGLDPATFQNTNENFLALVHPDDRARMGQAIADALARPGRFLQEYRLRRPDGRELAVRGEGDVVVDGNGQARRLFGFVQDVTELRRLEERERAARAEVAGSEARLRAVLDNASDAIVTGDATATIVGWNRAAQRIFGWSAAEAIGRPISDLMPAAQWDDYQRDVAGSLQGQPSRFLGRAREMVARRKDGGPVDVELSLAVWQAATGPMFTGVVRDITERLHLQEEREKRLATEAELDRLRRTDAFRSEFINNIAHELATPLTPLVLKVKTLLADKTLSATQRTAAETLDRSVQRLRHLVDEMVGAADLQARNLALDKRRLNLTRELRAAVAAHHPAAERAGVAMEDPEDTGITVSADPARLQLVLGHLLGNAIKFTPSGGRVGVTSHRTGTDEVRVEVKDNGVGLTRKQMDGLWRPFAQAHDKSQKTDSGSGLGLYVTKGIVELHGGEVGCSSPGPGQGSTFWFTLPLATGHVDPLARPKVQEAETEPRRNLNPGVAEDA